MSKSTLWVVWQHPSLGDGPIHEEFGTKAEAEAFLAGMKAAKLDPHGASQDFYGYSVEIDACFEHDAEKYLKYKKNLTSEIFFQCVCQLWRERCDCDHEGRTAVPFEDHAETFIDKKTGEKVFTSQPYIDNVGKHDVYFGGTERRMVRSVENITRESEAFAKEHGLSVRVSVEESWYSVYPEFPTVLVEYRKQ